MRRLLQRFPSFLAPNLCYSSTNSKTNPRIVVPSLNRLVFFSSESDSSQVSKSEEVISTEELKKRIQSFLEDGEEDEIPGLFEALMRRKLSGKHDDSDEDVMEEVRKYPVLNNVDKVGDTDSDIESDGLRDGDSYIESGGLKDGHSSTSDIDSDCDFSDSDIDFDSRNDIDLGVKIDGPSSNCDSESD